MRYVLSNLGSFYCFYNYQRCQYGGLRSAVYCQMGAGVFYHKDQNAYHGNGEDDGNGKSWDETRRVYDPTAEQGSDDCGGRCKSL